MFKVKSEVRAHRETDDPLIMPQCKLLMKELLGLVIAVNKC